MGWWSTEVLGGDEALDALSVICEAAGIEYNPANRSKKLTEERMYQYGYDISKQQISDNIRHIENAIRNSSTYSGIDHGYQVLGYIMLELDMNIEGNLYAHIFESFATDAWAEDGDEGRIRVMRDMMSKLRKSKTSKHV